MTVHLKGSTFVAFAAVSMALSGCFGSSSGGGITMEDVAARIDKIEALGETTAMPTALNATYKGAMGLDVYEDDGSGGTGKKTAELTGVLSIGVDWEDGSDAEVTGTASKFRGTAFVDGKKTKISPTGTLDVVANSGIIDKQYKTLEFDMSGKLKDGKDTVNALLSFDGKFHGTDAEGVTGEVNGKLYGNNDSEIVDGIFYLEKN